MRPYQEDYRRKRDWLTANLHPAYHLRAPDGSFYAFPQLPFAGGPDGRDTDSKAFLDAAVERNMLIVLGKAFSSRDTHFRLSFAAENETLERGVMVLNELAERFAAS